jgi:hypothetical protein
MLGVAASSIQDRQMGRQASSPVFFGPNID